MMKKLAICIGLALLLPGCAQVAQFASADANNAAKMASTAPDAQAAGRADCYRAWGALAGGLAAVPANTAGVFTGVEAGIEIQSTFQLPACQAIAGQVMIWALRKAPGGNLLP